MYPAAKDGDLVVFYRLDKDYEARDLIVLEVDGAKAVSYTHLDVYKRQIIFKLLKVVIIGKRLYKSQLSHC